MLKGIDLIGYALNNMKGDKLANMLVIAEEIGLFDGGTITSRAISLINPYNQYKFLEDIILEAKDSDQKLIDFLKSNSIALPLRYGWKHISYANGERREDDKYGCEWYDDKYACYRDMHKDAIQLLQNAMDCLDATPITITKNNIERITIKAGVFEDVYELYEME